MHDTITLKTGRTGGTAADGFEYRDRYDEIGVGDFLSESLVTDTIVWEVVKVTAKTVTIRTTRDAGEFTEDTAVDKAPMPVVWEAREANPAGATKTLRVRKDGSVRIGDHAGSSPLRPAPMVNGKPVRRIDYRF